MMKGSTKVRKRLVVSTVAPAHERAPNAAGTLGANGSLRSGAATCSIAVWAASTLGDISPVMYELKHAA